MTREYFLSKLDELLNDYCKDNPDYSNIHETRQIVRIDSYNVKEGVAVAISTYFYRKEIRS